ncbi:hypothetical protein HOT36_gp27 [Ralstonia phage RPSC1]|uniref:Uncharacterized protein n=1 Tax=Ralstonia phage RPSC1 TaxID=2041351 RepID=A0A2Z2U7W6_9CAUD|nr:hypothetical protein HOT36_gp27 [Ralstonia phage RPSC1]ATN92957.1 hypothetical protein RPSC1_26 [Ralstonia phage RPSC1]
MLASDSKPYRRYKVTAYHPGANHTETFEVDAQDIEEAHELAEEHYDALWGTEILSVQQLFD